MQRAWKFAFGAACSVATLLAGAGASTASEWMFAASKDSSTYTVSNDLVAEDGVGISIVYACAAGSGQRLDINIPATPFNARFLGDENVGIAWQWGENTSARKISFHGGTAFDQVKIDRSSGRSDGNVMLTFTSAGADILDVARRLSTADKPVAIGLFALGRKSPVTQSDILMDIAIPVEGAAAILGKAYALCRLNS